MLTGRAAARVVASTKGTTRTGTRVCCSTTRGGGPAWGLGRTIGIGCARTQMDATALTGIAWRRIGVWK